MYKKIWCLLLLLTGFNLIANAANDTPEVSVFADYNSGYFYLRMEHDRSDSFTIEVFNMLGVRVYNDSQLSVIGRSTIKINLSAQQNGMYIVRLQAKKWSLTRKLLLSHIASKADVIDILHTDLNLKLRNLSSKKLEGIASIVFTPNTDSVNTLVLDLLKLQVSAVSGRDSLYDIPFTQTDSTLIINLKKTVNPGDTDICLIAYSGNPVSDPTWGGFYFNGNFAYNMGVGFTSKPHSFGRCWFPCIDDFRERCTYHMTVNTDSGWRALCDGSEGISRSLGDGSVESEWHIHDPIPAYLASVAVGKYVPYRYNFQAMNRSIPVILATEAKDTAHARFAAGIVNDAMSCFESKFGPYPFERIGYVAVPFTAGAMEHATNIAFPMSAFNGTRNEESTFAHELAHMWWGNLATCRTAEDMWLNEGWASYCEAVFLECVYGYDRYKQSLLDKKVTTLLASPAQDKGFWPVSGIPQEYTYGIHVYRKGALMAHTLRTMLSDSPFFAACRAYLSTHRFIDVSSEELRETFQKFTSYDLTQFFENWIYSKGYEDIVVSALQNGNAHFTITLCKLKRYRPEVTASLPLEIECKSETGKVKLFQVEMDQPCQTFTLPYSADLMNVASVTVNPNNKIFLGQLREEYQLTAKGSLTMSNLLTSINVQEIKDTVYLRAEHHWTGPLEGHIKSKGIRVSTSRWWHFEGNFPSTFKSYVYFNYDGTSAGYKDEDDLKSMASEDSMVLLYRAAPDQEWSVHTDNTFQPGASKTDKLGRFWVTNLQAGDYAFGVRDHLVTGIHEQQAVDLKEELSIYPNPASRSITLSLSGERYLLVKVYDAMGKLVLQSPVNGLKSITLETASLHPGTYMVHVIGMNSILRGKFVLAE